MRRIITMIRRFAVSTNRSLTIWAIGLAGLFIPRIALAADVVTDSAESVTKIIDWVIEACVKYSFQVLGGLMLLAVGWFIGNFLARITLEMLKKKNIDVTVSKFISGAVKLLVMIFAAIAALSKFGIEIAPIIAGLSVVGFGTSFALQGPLSNSAGVPRL